jgi:branched-chain amino acid transport system ATP-binding protein
MNALEVEGTTVRFDGVTALDGVDLEVAEGERRAIVGPNGAGKSTLFAVIGGQLWPDSGVVRLFDREVTHATSYHRSALGLSRTWQVTNLFGPLSVWENVKLAVAATSSTRRVFWRSLDRYGAVVGRSEELLREWDLWDLRSQRVQDLGYGQQRLLEIVVALASQPKVLLLDEPTAGLSPTEADRMTSITLGLPENVTLVMIEHDMHVAFTVAQTMTVLVQGSLLASGPIEQVRENKEVIDAYLGEGSDAAAAG